MSRLLGLTLLTALCSGACTSVVTTFSDAGARVHLDTLGSRIGSRWIGTPANAQAREYLVAQLGMHGFVVRAEPAIARRAPLGLSARVINVVAVKAGEIPDAIAIVSHYDSVPDGPGGGDDAFGVAVSLEAARVLAAEPRRHTLIVLITDGEEAGLMGAAAAADDPEIGGRIRAYLNLEAVGSAGPALLFETGPANAWLTHVWARHGPHPRGSSLGIEVYRRLPNDTDFSMFKLRNIPGLNFAITEDGYGYHTDRDTPDRIPTASLRQAGDSTVQIVRALDAMDLTRRSDDEPVYFDVAGRAAVSYGSVTAWASALLAVLLGLVGWWRVARAAARLEGLGRLLLTLVWALLGIAAVLAGLVGAVWLLRMAREVHHPWYAHPDRLLALLVAMGVTAGWGVFRFGTILPAGLRGVRHPAIVWCFTLPVWIALAAVSAWMARAASFLWVVPLAAAALATVLTPVARARPAAPPDPERPEPEPRGGRALAVASIAVLAIAALVWLRDTYLLFHFVVVVFGRLSIVTPIWVYPALVVAGAVMMVPPLVAVLAAVSFTRRPPVVTAACLLAVAVAGALAYAAPAYTAERPLRRQVRFIQDGLAGRAFWEVAGLEPGIDLGEGSGLDWVPTREPAPTSLPIRRSPLPFVFRAETLAGRLPPAEAVSIVRSREQDVELTVRITPFEPGLTVSFVLPPGVVPLGANLPGRLGAGNRWSATFVAPPADGLEFRAFLEPSAAAAVAGAAVVVTSNRLPGQTDARRPGWLTTARTAWSARAVYLWRPPPALAAGAPGG